MTLSDGLRAIAGLPAHALVRPRGIMLVMNHRMHVLKMGKNGPHGWQPAYGDLVALDWTPVSPEQMKQARDQAAAEAGEG